LYVDESDKALLTQLIAIDEQHRTYSRETNLLNTMGKVIDSRVGAVTGHMATNAQSEYDSVAYNRALSALVQHVRAGNYDIHRVTSLLSVELPLKTEPPHTAILH
jgi:hypothetical protein